MQKNPYQEYIEWKKQKDSRWSKVSKQIRPIHVILILVLISVGNFFVSSGKISSSSLLTIVIGIGVFLLFLFFRKPEERTLIPEHIIKQIAQEALEKKRLLGIEIPFDSKINVTLVGEGIWEQDMVAGTSKMIKREVGFESRRKGFVKKGVIGVHPYDGTVLGIRWEKFGYTGKESKDRVIVPINLLNKEPES